MPSNFPNLFGVGQFQISDNRAEARASLMRTEEYSCPSVKRQRIRGILTIASVCFAGCSHHSSSQLSSWPWDQKDIWHVNDFVVLSVAALLGLPGFGKWSGIL